MISAIKQRIADRLQTHPDLTGRVHIEHERQLSESDLPCAVIRFIDAEADSTALGQLDWLGHYTITVTTAAAAPDQPALDAEQITTIVLGRLYTDTTLSGLLALPLRIDALRAELDAEGELVTRSIVIDVSIAWVDTLLNDPDDLTDLKTVHVDIDMASPRNDPQQPTRPDGQIDAQATIRLPQ